MYFSRTLAGQSQPNEIVIDDDEEYGGFDTAPVGLGSLQQDEGFQQALLSTPIGRKTALPSRSGYGLHRIGTSRLATGRIRTGLVTASGRPPGTASRLQTAGRPMTALRAAGYSGSTGSSSAQGKQVAPLATPPQDSLEEKVKQLENKIMSLVEESCYLRVSPETNILSPRNSEKQNLLDPAKSLSKAQEASGMERQLQRLQMQTGLIDSTNMDLSFTVMFNLACAYMRSGLPGEALQALHSSSANANSSLAFPPHAPSRRGLLAASAHLALGEHRRALKLYRMALDGTPASEKDLKLKIMHNIGLLLVRMGKFRDAVTNFQHMMHEGPDFTTGLHLVLCLVSLGDMNGAKAAFQALVHIDMEQDLDLSEEIHEKFFTGETEDAADAVFLDVLRADKLSIWAANRKAYRARCVLKAAKAIMLHDPNGLEWCAEVLRMSGRVGLAASLEGGAAARALRSGKSSAARATLRRLGNDSHAPPDARAAAACNLAFLSFLEGDISNAIKLSEEACAARAGCPSALIVRALCEVRASGGNGGWRTARDLLGAAIEADPMQRDAHYFHGLASEKLGMKSEANASYTLALRAVPADACTRVRQAALARASQDTDAAVHWYHQVIADSPHDHGVLVEMARMYEESGDLSMAQHCYLDADAIFPGSPEVAGWLGARARSAGDTTQALSYFRRAAQLSPNQVQWSLQEAACLRTMGKHKEALATYTSLHERHPDNIECLQMLVKLSGAAGLREAERWAAELQRARRAHQTSAESPLTIGSGGSSRGSSSPGAKGSLMSAGRNIARNSSLSEHHVVQPSAPPASGQDSLRRMVTSSGRKPSEDDQDLPLPPD